MSILVLGSLALRLVAFGLSLTLLRCRRDWRLAVFAAFLGLMAAVQGLEIAGTSDAWPPLPTAGPAEVADLLVSLLALVAAVGIGGLVRRPARVHERAGQAGAADDCAAPHGRASEAARLVEEIVEHLPGGIYRRVLHANGQLVFPLTSRYTIDELGIDGAAMAADGRVILDHIHPDDRQVWLDAVHRSAASLEMFDLEYRNLSPDGEVRWLRSIGKPNRQANGDVVWDGVAIDVTLQKEAAAALRNSEARFRGLVEGSIQGVIVQREMKPLFANRAFAEMFGFDGPAEVLALDSVLSLFAPEEHARLQEYTARLRGRTATFEYDSEAIRADGTPLQAHIMVRVVDWDGAPAVQSTVVDITRQRAAEDAVHRHLAEIAQVHRLATMGEMAAALAHELNQPLAAIYNYASGGLRRLESDNLAAAELDRMLREVAEQAKRANTVLHGIRNFLAGREQSREAVDLNRVAHAIAELSAAEARSEKVRIGLDLVADLPRVTMRRIAVEQAVLNLVRNGIEAMRGVRPEDRHLTIGTRADGGGRVELFVHDRGPGLPADDVDRIFEPFFSTKPAGMGMGLPITRTIVEAHGGRLWTYAHDDGGTVFRLSMPVEAGRVDDAA